MLRSLVAGVLLACALSGCRGEAELRCEPSARYAAAASVPPVRVPDDLSVPDESNSLRLPPEEGAGGPARRDCLEAPPPFFQDSRLGDQQANPAEQPPTGQQPAEQPPEPAEDPERQIGN